MKETDNFPENKINHKEILAKNATARTKIETAPNVHDRLRHGRCQKSSGNKL